MGAFGWMFITLNNIGSVDIDVIIPALNEEKALPQVLVALPRTELREIIVADNGSRDNTAEVARKNGATVVRENQKGYGAACLKALDYIAQKGKENRPDIVLFIDADYSDFPEEAKKILEPLLQGQADLVIGSRILGQRQTGAMPFHQKVGNKLSALLIGTLYGYHLSDLGPFRAIRYEVLQKLQMQDRNYGWTVEMQLKAAKMNYRITEVPVSYRPRIGQSKVSGTWKGSVLAASKILYLIFKHGLG